MDNKSEIPSHMKRDAKGRIRKRKGAIFGATNALDWDLTLNACSM